MPHRQHIAAIRLCLTCPSWSLYVLTNGVVARLLGYLVLLIARVTARQDSTSCLSCKHLYAPLNTRKKRPY